MTSHDAIIVGARVAGSATALCLARMGHRVLLVDKATFPSDTISSHLVKPRALAYLDRWGLRAALSAAQTDFRVPFTFNNQGFAVTGHATTEALRERWRRDHGWTNLEGLREGPLEWACIRRTVLDKILIDAARAAGAEVREGFEVSDLIRADDGRVLGICGGEGGSVRERGRVVIGADGRNSRVARAVGAKTLRESSICGYTYYAYWSGVDLRELELGVHLYGRLGLGYCPTNHGQVMVSVWGPRAWASDFRRDIAGNFARSVGFCYPQLAERLGAGVRETRFFGMIEQPNRVLQLSGLGWALVGDAGYQVDQCTAIGITHAFRGAQWLADDLHEGLAGERTLDEATANYERRVLASLDGYFDYVCQVARMEVPSVEQVALFDVLGRSPKLASRFFDFGASLLDYAEFHGPQGRERIAAEGGQPDPAKLRAYELRRPSHEQNPWAE